MLVLADAYRRLGRPDDARKQYEAVLAVTPADTEAGKATIDQAKQGLASLDASGSTETTAP